QLEDWEQYLIVSSLARVAAMMDAQDLDAAPLLTPGEDVG
ncbi:MAG: MarR family transcriptional regulator, partial [Pseudomonadota bacterium]